MRDYGYKRTHHGQMLRNNLSHHPPNTDGLFENAQGWIKEKAENVSDYVEDKLTERNKRKMEEGDQGDWPVLTWLMGKKSQREEAVNEYILYVDPRYYKITCDTQGRCFVGNMQVFVADPEKMDWFNSLYNYQQQYGIPADYLTMTTHYESIQTPNVGAKQALRENSAIAQKVIPYTDPKILFKVKNMMEGERAFLQGEVRKFELVELGAEKKQKVVSKFVETVSNTPLGVLIKITEFQIDLILQFLTTQIVNYDLLISQISSVLAKSSMASMIDQAQIYNTRQVLPQGVRSQIQLRNIPKSQTPAEKINKTFESATPQAEIPPRKNKLLVASAIGLVVLLSLKK